MGWSTHPGNHQCWSVTLKGVCWNGQPGKFGHVLGGNQSKTTSPLMAAGLNGDKADQSRELKILIPTSMWMACVQWIVSIVSHSAVFWCEIISIGHNSLWVDSLGSYAVGWGPHCCFRLLSWLGCFWKQIGYQQETYFLTTDDCEVWRWLWWIIQSSWGRDQTNGSAHVFSTTLEWTIYCPMLF